jgi:UDP-N-acetylglucosamine acyltransferase
MLVEGNPVRVWSINRVGLKRNEFTPEDMKSLKDAHRLLFRTPVSRHEAIRRLLKAHPRSDKVERLAKFLRNTERGNQGRARQP